MEARRSGVTLATTLDDVLSGICRALQLGRAARERIEQSYQAVGGWLSADDSPLAVYRPQVYPQGSVAMGLTVKPLGDGEYDVDLVLLLQAQESDFRRLYDLAWKRLAANLVYRDKLQRMSRCIRIDYAGDFHLDVLPARPDPARGGSYILIPDRELHGYKRSNPKGFIAWFDSRAGLLQAAKREAPEPLPPVETADNKSTLHRAVQLMKRRRDVIFDKRSDDAPPSILITCLAGEAYRGEASVAAALAQILGSIETKASQHRGPFVVANPSNPGENLAESWQTDRARYDDFRGYIRTMLAEVRALSTLTGPALSQRLRELYGESPVEEAFRQVGLQVQQSRMSSHLGATSSGLVIGSGIKRANPPHTFFGDGEE